MSKNDSREDISIVLCGAAGQGIQSVEDLLTKTFKKSGYNVFATREYMSRVRGGVNSTSIRVSSKPVRTYVDRMDILIPLIEPAISHTKHRISESTIIIGEEKYIQLASDINCHKLIIHFQEEATKIGNKILANIVALGIICKFLSVKREIFNEVLVKNFEDKSNEIIRMNKDAGKRGYEIAKELIADQKLNRDFKLEKDPSIEQDYILDGQQAVGLGAIAGGCNFETFYPMAPSTGIGTFLSQHGLDFSIIVDQSEDEISVINKALGASYAGARALVSTAGGGFSLMSEGLSLAGMSELPIVLIIGGRPAPATGMPTRTAQEDLDLVLHSGAGYFPRMIFAPGTIEDAFKLTQNAFNLAQEYQMPVFILTDQFLIDSYYNLKLPEHENIKIKNFYVKAEKDYKRYRFTENGISPRGIPGYGEGLVDADSHTHTEEGYITEDREIRERTVQKRLKKLELIKKIALPPKFIGDKDFEILLIAWGSNYYLIKEVIENMNGNFGFLHFNQVYPIHESAISYLKQAKRTILIENNPTGQFAKLLETETHNKIDDLILDYSGYPVSVEKLQKRIETILGGAKIGSQ